MNPSSTGWIEKRLYVLITAEKFWGLSRGAFYIKLRACGFIYGFSAGSIIQVGPTAYHWTEIEQTKVNLLDALAHSYFVHTGAMDGFLNQLLTFYTGLGAGQSNLGEHDLSKKAMGPALERILHERVGTNEGFLRKNFSHLVTNALIYIDVLSFENFIQQETGTGSYSAQLETLLLQTVWAALHQGEKKGEYDALLLKLFEKSVRYTKNINLREGAVDLPSLKSIMRPREKLYLLDLACLAVWEDGKLDTEEYDFLKELGKALAINQPTLDLAIHSLKKFIETHRSQISYFRYSNPIKHFYNQTNRTVSVLILRNKRRLLQELAESKDLALLMGQSTFRDLSKNEKKRVKEQLVDICKGIPSLAIFLLPGGGLLLPLLLKLIPQLLPSAFNENKIQPGSEEPPLSDART